MKEPEYIEGRQATKNFEDGMKALFKVPKDTGAKKNAKQPKATSRKSKRSDGD